MTIGDEQTAKLLASLEAGIDNFVKKKIDDSAKPDGYYQGNLLYPVEYKRFGIFRRTRMEPKYMTLAGWNIPGTDDGYWILEDGALCWWQTWIRRSLRTGQVISTRKGLDYNRPVDLDPESLQVLDDLLKKHS
jgi:hypothetical protein